MGPLYILFKSMALVKEMMKSTVEQNEKVNLNLTLKNQDSN